MRATHCLATCAFLCLIGLAGCDIVGLGSGPGLYAGGRLFGSSVALSGDYALVAASASDEAFFYRREGGRWREDGRARPGPEVGDDPHFARSIDLDGTTAIIGAPQFVPDLTEPLPGYAYVYERDGGTWTRTTLAAPDGIERGAGFGSAVSVDGDRIAVGAPRAKQGDTEAGAVLIFERTGSEWILTSRLDSPVIYRGPGGRRAGFGGGVTLQGDRLVVGGTVESQSGQYSYAAYIYGLAGESWVEESVIPSPDGTESGFAARAFVGSTLAIISPTRDNGDDPSGALYIYREVGGTWVQEADIPSPPFEDPGDALTLGYAFAADATENRVATSAVYKKDRGAAYTYVRSPDGTWSPEAVIEREGASQYDFFGDGVAIDGETLWVGAPGVKRDRGAAFVFERQSEAWVQTE